MRKTIFVGVDDGPRDSRLGKSSRGRESSARARSFVYVLRCAHASLYTGYTTDPRRRLAEHRSGSASKYTRSRLPVRLVYLEELRSRSEALRREIQIKKMKKEEKLLLCRAYSDREKLGSR